MAYRIQLDGDLHVRRILAEVGPRTHRDLRRRFRELTPALRYGAQARAPYLTGRLRREITARLYSDNPGRVAGYVYVAVRDQKDIAKAATLEYGTDRPRAVRDDARGTWRRLSHTKRRIRARSSAAVHIRAYRYLRGPFAEMRPQFLAAVAEGTAVTVEKANAELA